jgi:hypothetical protein
MERVNTEILLNTLEEKVEEHLRAAIGIFQNTEQSLLLKPREDGGWSIAQCLEHLNRYGNFYLPALKRGMDENKNRKADPWFKSSWAGNQFTRMMDPATGKMKMRTFKGYRPQRVLDADAVVAEFIRQQETLLLLLRQARGADLNKIRIPITLTRFIRLKAGDVFQFVIAHNERHVLQAQRNLTSVPVHDIGD